MSSNQKSGFTRNEVIRYLVFFSLSAAIVIFLIWQFFVIMVLSDPISIPPVSYEIERGPIYDRNGRILAIQSQMDSVSAWREAIEDPVQSAEYLSEILDLNQESLYQRFIGGASQFLYVKRKITKTEADQVRSLMEQDLLKGISLELEYGRIYPGEELASHVIGFTNVDNKGLAGVEYIMEGILQPESSDEELAFGNAVYLTIDANLQFIAEEIIQSAYERENPDYAFLLAMDPATGEVLAWASSPNFNLNNYSKYSDEERTNHPLIYSYEPGSVFKLFTVAAFLASGQIDERSEFFCPGYYDTVLSNGEEVRIKCTGVHGTVTPSDIIKFSCNAGAAAASESVSDQYLHDYLESLGFGKRTDIEMPGESNGILSPYSQWSGRSKPTIAIGQEITVTGAQILQAASALGNSGIMMKPHLIRRIEDSKGNTLSTSGDYELGRVLSKSDADALLQMMKGATEGGGTGTRTQIQGVEVSTKTGTAQTIDPLTKSYSDETFVASALSMIPTNDPKLVVYVVLYHPRGESIFGGRVAAPLIAEFGEYAVPYLGIVREEDQVILRDSRVRVTAPKTVEIGNSMPNLLGYSKREILTLFADSRLQITLNGEGWVFRQSPAPGTTIRQDSKIELDFN
jgi:cell division protein FtsI (penicillin-binding protein 3)